MNNNKSYHVLIIDDEAEIRHALNYLFSGQGWSVSELTSAEGAAQKMASLSPDLVISDVRMPGLSGLDFFASLKNPDTSPPLSFYLPMLMSLWLLRLCVWGLILFMKSPLSQNN
jgi:DNA-binding NtrC family response regulator